MELLAKCLPFLFRPSPPAILDTFYRPPDPRLPNLDALLNNTSESISTEDSLAINSAALKYLDDRQLTHMHIKRNGNIGAGAAAPAAHNSESSSPKQRLILLEQTKPGLTEYGLAECQMSMATKQYLEGNKFLAAAKGNETSAPPVIYHPPRKVLDNLTDLLAQPKLS